jgi:hypothetical protein
MAVSSRGIRGVLALACLAAFVATPGVGLASGLTYDETVEGELLMLHADDFVRGNSTEVLAVHTRTGAFVEADLSRVRGRDRLIGKQVRLSGKRIRYVGDESASVFVASGSVTTSAAEVATAVAASTRRVALIMINFRNDSSQPWSKDFASDTVFGQGSSVATYYDEVSYGGMTLGGTVFGWYTIASDNTGCRYGEWGSAALAASSIDVADYTNIIYAFPRTADCQWSGLSTVGGKYAWINGAMTVRTVGHELAHMMGVHHASALNCVSNGARVTWSSNCTKSEYGDPFSIMGTGTRHLHNWHRAQIGWVPEMITVTSSGEYEVAPAEMTDQPRLVRVARGDGTFLYFEFRQPFGTFDKFGSGASATSGVTIRVAPDKPTRTQSQLLDMTPSTHSFDDAALIVGRAFTDPMSGVTVSTGSVSANAATVSVRFPGTESPEPSPTPSPSPSATPPPPTASHLTAPTDVNAEQLRGRKVRVTWAASIGGEVKVYRIFRNGIRVGRTSELRFRDWVPRGTRRVKYVVRAVDRRGYVSPKSTAFILYMRR